MKDLSHLKPDKILQLFLLNSSESLLLGIKASKNSIGIPSRLQALKLGVDEITSLKYHIL